MKIHKKKASPERAADINIEFLDASIRHVEALTDYKIALIYGEGDAENLKREIAATVSQVKGILKDASEFSVEIPFERLVKNYSLDENETLILRIAIAPYLDSSFKKRISRLKDNILLDYVDVDFLLTVMFDTRLQRLKGREYFLRKSKLVSEKLITMTLPRDAVSDSLLIHEVGVPERIVNFVLGHDALDRTIVNCSTLLKPEVSLDQVVLDDGVKSDLEAIITGYLKNRQERGLVIQVNGQPGTGKSLLASSLASKFDRQLILVDSFKLANDETNFKTAIENIFLDTRMRDAFLCFDHCDALFNQKNQHLPAIFRFFEQFNCPVFLLTSDPRLIDPSVERRVVYQVDCELPGQPAREKIWQIHLDSSGVKIDESVYIPNLASTFEFTGGQIRNAVELAASKAASENRKSVGQEDLIRAAYAQIRADMEEYASRRRVALTLNDLILPEEELKLVREVLDAARNRPFIMNQWGFGKRLVTGKGIVCMFVGESGTGKTLCAEILASELGLKLYQISIPRVMSKYIGETEKNIAQIFTTARANNSMLLFDEADALFTSRVKVETSVDRFSNMEVNLLLQEIERFEGIVILTTNLEKNIDKAFERRIQFKIRFPFPDPIHRWKIWKTLIPKECPVAPDIDFELLGKNFELSGGNIKNAIIRAAYRAAKDNSIIKMSHIISAAEAECKAAGRLFRGVNQEDDF